MHEKRLSHRLRTYWDGMREADNNNLPDIRKFNTGAIEDVWQHCFRVSISSSAKKPSYKYEHMGTAIVQMYGRDLTGQAVDGVNQAFPGKVIYGKFNEIISQPQPLYDEGFFMNERDSLVKYRACLLPFGTAKDGITDILVGLSCRSFR
jgi:hypothetical protein